MTTVYQDIQTVRSLRKELRDPNLSLSVMNAIETIHGCIQSGTDLNGWKKVNWRSSGGVTNAGGNNNSGRSYVSDRADSYRSNTHSSYNNSKGNGFFRSATQTSVSRTGTSAGAGSGAGAGAGAGTYNSPFGSGVSRFRNNTQSSAPIASTSSNTTSFPLSSGNPTNTTNVFSSSSHSSSSHTPSFSSPHSKYVSKFKKDTDAIDDTIINTIILGKLNKMSVANYDEIKEFITHIIDSNQTEMTKCFMRLVFQKATIEEIFCPLYARLLGELSSSYPVLLTEMTNLYNSYMAIFEEVNESNEANYTEFVKRNVEKKYRRGYSQFLAELIKHGVINTDNFAKTINTIIKQVETNTCNADSVKLNEEYAECLTRIINAIKSDDIDDDDDNIEEIKRMIKNDMHQRIKPFSIKNPENKGISTKARFSFLNIYEDIQKF